MVSTRRLSRAELVVSNAWLWADGGYIFADALNAGTSAAVIVPQISMHRSITPPRVTRQSRASSRASIGSTTIARSNSSPARSFTLLTVIHWISRHPDRLERCLQTGKRCCTNSGRLLSSASGHASVGTRCREVALSKLRGNDASGRQRHFAPRKSSEFFAVEPP